MTVPFAMLKISLVARFEFDRCVLPGHGHGQNGAGRNPASGVHVAVLRLVGIRVLGTPTHLLSYDFL